MLSPKRDSIHRSLKESLLEFDTLPNNPSHHGWIGPVWFMLGRGPSGVEMGINWGMVGCVPRGVELFGMSWVWGLVVCVGVCVCGVLHEVGLGWVLLCGVVF